MASQHPPKRGVAYTYSVSLVSQADTKIFKTSATLAAGDVTISKDGAGFGNVEALPTEIATTGVLVGGLSATEMTADRVVVRFRDAAGAEWCDLLLVLDTVAANFDDLNTDVDAILADTGTDGVLLAATQGAVDFGQVTIAASVADEGALHIVNSHSDGHGLYAQGGSSGQTNTGAIGQHNLGTTTNGSGQRNEANNTGGTGQYNYAPASGGIGQYDYGISGGLTVGSSGGDPVSPMWAQASDLAGLNDLDATEVQTAAEAALVAYDGVTQTDLDAAQAAIEAAITALNDISVANILAGVVEGSITVQGALRIALAVLAGKSSGGGTTTIAFRDVADSKPRVTATVTSAGNRTAVTRDVSD